MKKSPLFSLLILLSFVAPAQSNKEDIDIIQALYGKDKKAIVAEFIKPEEAKKQAFWSLYDEYETHRKALGQKRVALLEKYVNSYDSLKDKSTDDMIKQIMTLQKSTDGLIDQYYEKMKTSVGSNQAAQFYHIETYLLSAIRTFILGNMPYINSLEKTAASHPHS